MPSSLTTLLPLALESSSYLPVSVCGTGTSEIHMAFLATFHAGLRYLFPSISTGTNSRLRHFRCVPMLNSFGGDGISTVCASATPSGLTLAPDYLGADEPSSKNLRLSAMQILTAFALLIPAFSLLYTPQPLALLFLRVYNAPLPSILRRCLSFGVRFSPVKFSAQRRSTSELLRTL